VSLFQKVVVGDGLTVGFSRLGVALSGEEEPSQEKQRLLVGAPEFFLAGKSPFAIREVFEVIAPVELCGLLQVVDGLFWRPGPQAISLRKVRGVKDAYPR
jgi:hypothetical protein